MKLLLICYSDPLGLLAVQDNINTLKRLSTHNLHVLNLFPNIAIQKKLDLSGFDGVIFHSTVAYDPTTLYTLDKNLSLNTFTGIKILFKQDEHVQSHTTARFIGEAGINLVLTCLPEHEISKVYPQSLVGDATFLRHLTGYISDDLITRATSREYLRCTDIAYRGSIQPLQCGRLGYEKWSIGDSIQAKLSSEFINLDISSAWSNRIHGNDWIKFLLSTKATLGVESGSNLFDFNGEVEEKCNVFKRKNAALLQQDPETYYLKAKNKFLSNYENNVCYAQISPRHFEAAATKTLQILYEGEYSNIFIPYKHYLPLKRDLSNIGEVLEFVSNTKKRRFITDCAYEEIVLNKNYHIESFVKQFDQHVNQLTSKKIRSKNITPTPTNPSQSNVMILVPHELHLDPRVQWLEKGYSNFSNVICIGITNKAQLDEFIIDSKHSNHIHANLAHANVLSPSYPTELITEDYTILYHQLSQFSDRKNIQYPDNKMYDNDTIDRHEWYCNHIKAIDACLQQTVKKIIDFNHSTPELIVCVDLSTLISGVFLSQHYGIPLVYDAHEFWAYADVRRKPWETDFWLHYERTLLRYVNLCVTVSDGLANLIHKLYDHTFLVVPNTELKSDNLSITTKKETNHEHDILFLYQGAFAPGRGLDKLITAWVNINKHCKLILRGHPNDDLNELEKLAEHHGLLNQTVFIAPPVKEHELVTQAAQADVGIVPYDQNISEAYKFCSPNKLSQYMAAGLPILSNDLPEVSNALKKANCGYSVDFDDTQALINIIHVLGEDHALRRTLGQRARHYFLNTYHWEYQANELYTRSKMLIDTHRITLQTTKFSTHFLSEEYGLFPADITSLKSSSTPPPNKVNIEPIKSSSKRPHSLTIVILYDPSCTNVPTIKEYLSSFYIYSQHDIAYLPATQGIICQTDLNTFDVVIIHYSVRLSVSTGNYTFSPSYLQAVQVFNGQKILFLQDEYEGTNTAKQWITHLNIHTVYTCVPERYINQIYPKASFPNVDFISILTGYVSTKIPTQNPVAPTARDILIGYRGRALPYWYGSLGQEKLNIGKHVKAYCTQHNLNVDIEWEESNRIYGDAWYTFLGRCRATLGTESGANLFDYDGSIRATIEEKLHANPHLSYESIAKEHITPYETIQMNQISPKIFEAITLRTALILFEGAYSNILIAGVHYIPLKKDFSNLDWVINQVQDDDIINKLTQKAYTDIIESHRYSYQTFIHDIDAYILNKMRASTPSKIIKFLDIGKVFSSELQTTSKTSHMLTRPSHTIYTLEQIESPLPLSSANKQKKKYEKKKKPRILIKSYSISLNMIRLMTPKYIKTLTRKTMPTSLKNKLGPFIHRFLS
jgi:glycosyltransferase involved in cell wall biosynthesis